MSVVRNPLGIELWNIPGAVAPAPRPAVIPVGAVGAGAPETACVPDDVVELVVPASETAVTPVGAAGVDAPDDAGAVAVVSAATVAVPVAPCGAEPATAAGSAPGSATAG